MFSRLQLMWGDLIRWPDSCFAGGEQGEGARVHALHAWISIQLWWQDFNRERSQWSVYCGVTNDFAHATIAHLTQATRSIAQVHHAARCVGARPELPEPSIFLKSWDYNAGNSWVNFTFTISWHRSDFDQKWPARRFPGVEENELPEGFLGVVRLHGLDCG